MEIGFNVETILQSTIVVAIGGAWRSWASMRKEMHQFHRDLAIWQSKIDTVLFGPHGNNGFAGTLKSHEIRLQEIERDARH